MRLRRILSTSALALVVTTSPALSTSTQANTSSTVSVPNIRIGNFGRISAGYYRGEQPYGRDYADLAALGIKTVIDLQADGENYDEPQLVEAAGMRFYRIPMMTRVPPTAEQLALFRDIVNDPAQQPVFVHCKGGKHRTGVMTAVYRMENDGWTADRAFKEMKDYKFGLDFLHPEFKAFVFSYDAPQHSTPVETVAATAARN